MIRKITCPKCNAVLYLDDAQRVHYCERCGNLLTVHNASVEKGKNNGKVGVAIVCALLFLAVISAVLSYESSYDREDNVRENEAVEVAKAQPEETLTTSEESEIETAEKKIDVPNKTERRADAKTTNKEEMVTSGKEETEITNEAKTETTDKVEKKSEETKPSDSGVNPDLKAFLDSYEAFMDKYVAFMKKYLDSANSGDFENYMAMYQDYMELLVQMEDYEKKADQYDSESMSAVDLAYYLGSLNRIQMKMLEAYY